MFKYLFYYYISLAIFFYFEIIFIYTFVFFYVSFFSLPQFLLTSNVFGTTSLFSFVLFYRILIVTWFRGYQVVFLYLLIAFRVSFCIWLCLITNWDLRQYWTCDTILFLVFSSELTQTYGFFFQFWHLLFNCSKKFVLFIFSKYCFMYITFVEILFLFWKYLACILWYVPWL